MTLKHRVPLSQRKLGFAAVLVVLCHVQTARAEVGLLALNADDATLTALTVATTFRVSSYDQDLDGVDFVSLVSNRASAYCISGVSHFVAIDFMASPHRIIGPIDCQSNEKYREAKRTYNDWSQWVAPVPSKISGGEARGELLWLGLALNRAYEKLPVHGPCDTPTYSSVVPDAAKTPEQLYVSKIPLILCTALDGRPVAPLFESVVLSEFDPNAANVVARIHLVNHELGNAVARFLLAERLNVLQQPVNSFSQNGDWSLDCNLRRVARASPLRVACTTSKGQDQRRYGLDIPVKVDSFAKSLNVAASVRTRLAAQMSGLFVWAMPHNPASWTVLELSSSGAASKSYIGSVVLRGSRIRRFRYMDESGRCVAWMEGSSERLALRGAADSVLNSVGATPFRGDANCGTALPSHF